MLEYDAQQDTGFSVFDFQCAFTQPYPSYGVYINDSWKTVPAKLSWRVANSHLEQKRTVGSLARWYTQYGILDFDDVPLSYVQQARHSLAMDEHNSLLFTSASPNSYHLYFKPVVGDELPTLRYFNKLTHYISKTFCEVYPQAKRIIRLPFGQHQDILDSQGHRQPLDWQEGMHQLAGLANYDLASHASYSPEWDAYNQQHVGYHGLYDEWDALAKTQQLPVLTKLQAGWKREGLVYLNEGLSQPRSRYHALLRVVYFFWSQNVEPAQCILQTTQWLAKKHHGYSKDWQQDRRKVKEQIQAITAWIYANFAKRYILPDVPRMVDVGYHSAQSVQAVVAKCGGNLPLLKFALPLVSYCLARGGRGVQVHRDKLVGWSSATNYVGYLERLEQVGLISRTNQYAVDIHSKKVHVHVERPDRFVMLSEAKDKDRPETHAKKLLQASFSVQAWYNLQNKNKCDRRTLYSQIEEIYGEAKPVNIKFAKQTTQEQIIAYRKTHPRASQTQASSDLGLGLRTIKRYWQEYEPESLADQVLAYHQEHPLVGTRTIAKVLEIHPSTVSRILFKSVAKGAKLSEN